MRTKTKSFTKIKQMQGGGDGYMPGIDINDISEFDPTSIPDIVLWVTADKTKIVYSTIQDYVLNLSPSIAKHILDQYKSNPSQKVAVEIESQLTSIPNSLVRLELDTESAVGFPKFITRPGTLDIIDMSNLIDPKNNEKQTYKLTTKKSVAIPQNFSSWIISNNVKVEYIDIIQKIVLSTPFVDTPTTTIIQNPDGTIGVEAVPTADFSEVIVYARKLSDNEAAILDGYIAYRKNEQYMLKLNNPYFPSIDTLPFLKEIASQIQDNENSLKLELDSFDESVSEYQSKLPNDPILEKAKPIKEKATYALKYISEIRVNITRGGLLSRKLGTETTDSMFQSMADLSLYNPPLTQQSLSTKLAEISAVLQELESYTKSLGTVDEVKAKTDAHNNENDQKKQMNSAKNLEQLRDTQIQTENRELYSNLRKQSDKINADGENYYNSLASDFAKQIKTMNDAFQYYAKDIESRWNKINQQFDNIDTQISSRNWLSYVPSIDTSIVSQTKRGDTIFSIQYTNSYLNQIQNLYEQIRNQIKEGDFIFIKEECLFHSATMAKFYKKLQNTGINPFCKKTFLPYFKNTYSLIETYAEEFDNFYSVFNDAITTLSMTLDWNKNNKQTAKITKIFPIAIVYKYSKSIQERCIRKLNYYDNCLSMIEYIYTNADGTIFYKESEEKEIELFFPSLENINKNEQDMFYMKKTPFIDENGHSIYQKYKILEAYEKGISILDALPESTIIPRYFHIIDSIYEIPREFINGVHELSMESPQRPVLLPKYGLKLGSFYICSNVGKIVIQIQIGDEIIDSLGPGEICVYNYTKTSPNYYGRKFWNSTRIAYDTLMDTPRSQIITKIIELSIYVYMLTETDPLFDKDGFLIQAKPDDSGTIYDIDDVYHARPYTVKINGEKHLSDLSIYTEWGEKMTIRDSSKNIHVAIERLTNFPVFCNSNGIAGIDEYGFCKYVLTPILHINDSIRTRGSGTELVQISLNNSETIIQYGIIPNTIIFQFLFRSMFVKENGEGYIFVNSSGYPIVSPQNTYINVDNSSLNPPYLLFYTDVVKQLHAYLLKDIDTTITNTTPLTVASYRFIDIDNKRQEITHKNIGTILSYRYKIDRYYIKYVLGTIEIKYNYCRSYTFDETKDTLSLLQQCYTDIEKYQLDFSSYSSNIQMMEFKQSSSNTNKQIKLAIDTLEIKMKDILEKVFSSFIKAENAIQFFTKILQSIELIKKSVKRLREVIILENEKNILEIQGVIQQDKQIQENSPSPELSDVLTKILNLKLDFETRLQLLEKNIDSIPTFLVDLDTWIQNQKMLIKKEYDIRKQIMQMVNTNVVDVYTKRLKKNSSSTLLQIKNIRDKADAYLFYKKTISLWLEIWSIESDVANYSKENIHTSDKSFKGYSITFPVFEDISNPLVSRDWKSLVDNTEISDSLRSRISLELIIPIQKFAEVNNIYFNTINDTDSIPTVESLRDTNTDDLKNILVKSKLTIDNLIANAITLEASLILIFENYKKIRSDLRSEFQGIIQDKATNIQKIWTNLTGEKTAIQTSIQILQDYFTGDQTNRATDIINSIDQVITPEITESVEKVQQSTKVSDFYVNMSYIRMIQIQNERNDLIKSLELLEHELQPIQIQFNNLQSDVLNSLQNSIIKEKNNLNDSVIKAKANLSDSDIQTLQDTIQPKIDTMMNKPTDTISNCIEIYTKIEEINKDLQGLTGG